MAKYGFGKPTDPVCVPSNGLAAIPRRRQGRHSSHQNFCAARPRNAPRKHAKQRTRCRPCEDKHAGIPWRQRNKKRFARLPSCTIKKTAARRYIVSDVEKARTAATTQEPSAAELPLQDQAALRTPDGPLVVREGAGHCERAAPCATLRARRAEGGAARAIGRAGGSRSA
mmetsp:Transcript_63905/g.170423  ORF Transcript_63905/g.170423 Transcript_63905/m.170423 type:complete len:170 (+) Transcript_63905:80-589(+)